MSHAYHTSVAVSDITKSKRLYKGIFEQLRWHIKYEDEESISFTDGRFEFWLITADNSGPGRQQGSVGFTHFAFRVQTKEEVDAFYKWLLTSSAVVDIEPKAYPEYTEKYYAVFFFDNDGTRLEVVYT